MGRKEYGQLLLLVHFSHHLLQSHEHILGHKPVGGKGNGNDISLALHLEDIILKSAVARYIAHHLHAQSLPWSAVYRVSASTVVIAGDAHYLHVGIGTMYIHEGVGQHCLHRGRWLHSVIHVARDDKGVGFLFLHNPCHLPQHVGMFLLARKVV